MKIELFLDEDVHSGLAHALRKRGYDVVHAQELDRKGRSDSDQLLFAIQQKRCIFTFNVKDFVILHNHYAKSRKEHWGVIFTKYEKNYIINAKNIFLCAYAWHCFSG